jgi:ABC-type polar amino acid transport system ATPase subunit
LRPITKPDVDNLAKTTMDAMSGFIWLDDSQVITLFSKKFYSRKPRTEIKVKYQLDFLSSIFARYNLEKHKTIEKNNKIKAEKEAQKLAEKEAKKLQKKLEREKLKKEKSKGGKKNERKKI